MAYYGYIRVSTKGQVPGTSLAEQEQQIKERYPTATIVKEAASGAHERQAFDNLCKTLQADGLWQRCCLLLLNLKERR